MTPCPCVKIASSGNVFYHPAATRILCVIRYYPARITKPRIRLNNQAPPHNAIQHLAPTITTIHYPTSLHISPHHQTSCCISRNTLHRNTGPTNITYRPALSSTCRHHRARRRPMLHHATPLCAALHSIALPRTNLHY